MFSSAALLIVIYYNKYKEFIIDDVVLCNVLIDSQGNSYTMAGVAIPYEGEYYREEMCINIQQLLKGRKFKYKIVLRADKKRMYPISPKIYLYTLNGVSINEKLVKEGMAFFDLGYFNGSRHFYNLQEKARKNKLGMWGLDNPPQVKYVGKWEWRFYHYPECPEVKDLKDDEKINFFFHPLKIPGARIWAYQCSYCAPLFKEREGLEIDKIYPS